MFQRIAQLFFNNNTQDIFLLQPEQLLRLIEAVWTEAPVQNVDELPLLSGGRPSLPSLLKSDTASLLGGPTIDPQQTNLAIAGRFAAIGADLIGSKSVPASPFRVDWNHMIYAYMLENTRMVQIFHRVLNAYYTGEDLGTPSFQTAAWLRNTEALFYRHLPGSYMMNIRSEVRPDPEATRRNAYYRLLGMDLGHGTMDNKPYLFPKPSHSNKKFAATLEKLLYEINQGLINRGNSSGVNTTDYASMVNLFRTLANMLQLRRQGGNLSRVEFNAVTMMSWFHLTLQQTNFSLINDLGARANSPEDRLMKIGKKVGLPANPKSGNFLELGELLSEFLLQVEANQYDSVNAVQASFAPGNTPFAQLLTRIINEYSIATGRNIKAQVARPALAGR